MSTMSKNSTTGNYELSITPTTSAQTKTIKVSGTYCDTDIDVKVSAIPNSYIIPSGNIELTKATSTDVTSYATATVRSGSASVNNSSITPSFSQSGNVVTVTGSATSSATVSTSGWIVSITSGTASIATTSNVNKYTIPSGNFNNAATSNVTYTENTDAGTVIPANGYLYLNAGYFPNTKISLAHLIPDPSTGEANPGVGDIRSGSVAYDGDGNKIVGTMADVTPTFSGGTPSLTNKANTITVTGMATTNVATNYYIDAVAGRNAVEMILAIYKSAATGSPVKLPLKDVASTDFVGRFG